MIKTVYFTGYRHSFDIASGPMPERYKDLFWSLEGSRRLKVWQGFVFCVLTIQFVIALKPKGNYASKFYTVLKLPCLARRREMNDWRTIKWLEHQGIQRRVAAVGAPVEPE